MKEDNLDIYTFLIRPRKKKLAIKVIKELVRYTQLCLSINDDTNKIIRISLIGEKNDIEKIKKEINKYFDNDGYYTKVLLKQ